MQLYYYSGFDEIKNFGDELNKIIWDRTIPGMLDNNSSELFVGIVTLLNNRIPINSNTVIMGAGVGYGDLPSKKQINEWSIYCVRGYLSAKALGVPVDKVATDPAILVNRLYSGVELKTHEFSFMPHWMNMGNSWKAICDNLGIKLLNPLGDIDDLISSMKRSKVVIAEAMHAAIVADSLRIPWIPVASSFPDSLPFKWQDWCSSLNISYEPYMIYRLWHDPSELKRLSKRSIIKFALRPINHFILEKKMRDIMMSASPTLSNDLDFDCALNKVENAIDVFKKDYSFKSPRI